jgi:hypothetical protein
MYSSPEMKAAHQAEIKARDALPDSAFPREVGRRKTCELRWRQLRFTFDGTPKRELEQLVYRDMETRKATSVKGHFRYERHEEPFWVEVPTVAS